MQNNEKIRLLEEVLVSYIEKYGFTPEARRYFIKSFQSEILECWGKANEPTKH